MQSRLQFSSILLSIALCLIIIPLIISTAAAQQPQYPYKPVSLIVPWPAGGATDIAVRALARSTEGYLGQPIVIENRPGASGTTAPISMARTAEPDGYTLTQVPTSLIRATVMKDLDFDPVSDLTPVICLTGYVFGFVVEANAPWRNFQELLADAKARSGAIRIASSGYGTTPHIVLLKIAQQQGLTWTHVPFSGSASSVNALLGKHVDVIADGSSWSELVASGTFRLLATWGETRNENWPEVPTLKEMGIDIVVRAPYSLAGPKGMPAEIVGILHDAFRRGMQEKSYRTTLKELGQEPFYLNSRDCRDAIARQREDERQTLMLLNMAGTPKQ